jgi:L-lactate dehydrogenase complex protein LldG
MSLTPGQQLGAREAILAKIRRALQVPAPYPGAHGHGPTEGAVTRGEQPSQNHLHAPVKPGSAAQEGEATGTTDKTGQPKVLQSLTVLSNTPEWSQWLVPPGATWEEWADLFAKSSVGLKTEFYLLDGPEAAAETLLKIKAESGWTKAGTHAGHLTDPAVEALGLPTIRTDITGYDPNELAACEVGISECDALIAQTGTVLLCTQSAGGRALSILPPHHVVLARRDQLLPDMPTAFAVLHERYGSTWPSLVTFITGPSRTGDIERILVLGAHGPKRLTVVCY